MYYVYIYMTIFIYFDRSFIYILTGLKNILLSKLRDIVSVQKRIITA